MREGTLVPGCGKVLTEGVFCKICKLDMCDRCWKKQHHKNEKLKDYKEKIVSGSYETEVLQGLKSRYKNNLDVLEPKEKEPFKPKPHPSLKEDIP